MIDDKSASETSFELKNSVLFQDKLDHENHT